MTSLVEEHQRAALDEDKGTSSLLRIAMTVARKLGLPEIDEFLKYELHGYPEDVGVPPYRVVRGTHLARNTLGREVPVMLENDEERDAVELRSATIASPFFSVSFVLT